MYKYRYWGLHGYRSMLTRVKRDTPIRKAIRWHQVNLRLSCLWNEPIKQFKQIKEG